uniref:Uncharacterized protein n=1 Tax=Romanomermis culicivorax TaxID=13658 RepID=A0A915JER2_ROMCU
KFFAANFLLTISAIGICVTLSSIKNFKESQINFPVFAQRIQEARLMKILVAIFSPRDCENEKSEKEKILIEQNLDVENGNKEINFGNRWSEFAADMQAILLIFYCILYSILFLAYL